MYLLVDSRTEDWNITNKYVSILLDVSQGVGAAVLVAVASFLLTAANRLTLSFEWRLAAGATPSVGEPSLPARGQIVNLQLLTSSTSRRARWVCDKTGSGGMNIHIRFRPEDALTLRIEDQSPRRLAVHSDCITIRGLEFAPGPVCFADVSVERRGSSTHSIPAKFAVSIEWTGENKLITAILSRSVRIDAGVAGFNMRGVT